jgi:diacylglycerol kinase family enzyme
MDVFLFFLKHFQKHRVENDKPCLLTLDGHKSHTKAVAALQYAQKNKINILVLPPHTSHKTQPLDRCLFVQATEAKIPASLSDLLEGESWTSHHKE